MGAGGVIQQRAAIRTAANDLSIFDALPKVFQDRVLKISIKGIADWTDAETGFMAAMLSVAVHYG